MNLPLIQFAPWDKSFALNPDNLPLALGETMVVATETGLEAGPVVGFEDLSEQQLAGLNLNKKIDRQAANDDLQIIKDLNWEKERALETCRRLIKKHGLEMKLVDAVFSFDGQRLTFAFIADGRVDFRDLVKELGREFQKIIRLHQIGVRDEAKMKGDIGCCGLIQCCQSHLKKLGNVVSEFAEDQQVVHRGSERLSGICGRLKCCLAYEEPLYAELNKKLPAIGSSIKTKYGKGEIIGWHTLKGTVDVEISPEKEGERPLIVEVPIDD